jgi:hypothetical protein
VTKARTPASPGALHVAGDHHKVGRVAGEAVNGRDYHDIAGAKGGHQLLNPTFATGRSKSRKPLIFCG